MMIRSLPHRVGRVTVFVLVAMVAFSAVYPLIFTGVTGFRSREEYAVDPIGIPRSLDASNYVEVFGSLPLGRYLINSAVLVPAALAIYLLLTCAAGFGFGTLSFPGRRHLFFLLVILMVFPQMLVVVKLFQLLAAARLVNTYAGVLLVWIAYFSPFGTYLLTSYFVTVPKSLVESARLDGAGSFSILTRIMMPVARPMIAVVLIVGFLAMWNELPFSVLILQNASMRTLVLGIALLQGEYGLPAPSTAAATLIASTIPLIFFAVLQNQIMGGQIAGAVKG